MNTEASGTEATNGEGLRGEAAPQPDRTRIVDA
jgi:hypothetical protein